MVDSELKTADGYRWEIFAMEENETLILSQLKHALGIDRQGSTPDAVPKARQTKKISIIVSQSKYRWRDLPAEHGHEVECRVGPVHTPEKMAFQLTRVAYVVANASEEIGGLLVHGALAAWNGMGVILAGPGGVGKTTASKKLPSPWRSLSDDTALIVKAEDGTYWAHPWPTWSRYRQGDMSGSWDVQTAVKLDLICMLRQGKDDRVCHLPVCQAINELVDVSGQTFFNMANGMKKEAIRRINLMRFHNAVTISKKIPICRLEISRNGNFWTEIEKCLVSRG